ncbi:DUF4199 family protein [Paraflavitalea soli]|uniref:DUF4199 family protein n=1 Tax=Paraflavitalea soli TaxID=2315862 RepID=A0A3B7MN27_9BACT|nr:DUF4199 family protein [Paraflavitalea soli]AXY74430.1 DUF4199 family protein [Paraflavitalea soli]
MEKKTTSAVTVGFLTGLVLVVLALVVYFTKLYLEKWGQYLGLGIFMAAIIWAVINHGKETNHSAGFGTLFGFGFKTVAVVICIMVIYTALSGYLFPDVKEAIIENSRAEALKQPNVSEADVEQGLQMFAKNYTMFIIMIILFWYLVLGVIASLIGAAVTKKIPQSPFENSFKP